MTQQSESKFTINDAIQEAQMLGESKRQNAQKERNRQVIRSWLKPIPNKLRTMVVLEKVKTRHGQPYAGLLRLSNLELKGESGLLFHRHAGGIDSIQSLRDLDVEHFGKSQRFSKILMGLEIGLTLLLALAIQIWVITSLDSEVIASRIFLEACVLMLLVCAFGTYQVFLPDEKSLVRFLVSAWEEPSVELQVIFANVANQTGDEQT
jgi:hypothetical protein